MGVPVLPSTLVNGTTADAVPVMADLNAIVAELTGEIDRDNLKNGEVITAKIADAAVTAAKLAPDLPPSVIDFDPFWKVMTGGSIAGPVSQVVPGTDFVPAAGLYLVVLTAEVLCHTSSGPSWFDVRVAGIEVFQTAEIANGTTGGDLELSTSGCGFAGFDGTQHFDVFADIGVDSTIQRVKAVGLKIPS